MPTNNGSIKFSVIIPVYNVERYLSECVESVLAQTYSRYEIILVDDGLSDDSGWFSDYLGVSMRSSGYI